MRRYHYIIVHIQSSRMKTFLPRVVLILLSMALFFIGGEVIIRLFTQEHLSYDIEMAKYANMLKIDSPNPKIGHVHKPNSSTRLMGVDIKINSDGLRGSERTIEKNNRYRIIFLGDSLTLGWGVSEDKTFKSLLEKELNKDKPTEILNFGIGNYNTEQEEALFEEKGLKYHPDKVVMFYFINDAEETPNKSPLSFLQQSYVATFYWSKILEVAGKLGFGNNYISYYEALYTDQAPGWKKTREAFLYLQDITRNNKISLQIVLLPEFHNVANYPFTREHAKVTSFLQEHGISSLDLVSLFSRSSNPQRLWVAQDDAHPNEKGHELIAKYTLDFLKKTN